VPISYAGRSRTEGKKIGLRDGLKALATIVKFGRPLLIRCRDPCPAARRRPSRVGAVRRTVRSGPKPGGHARRTGLPGRMVARQDSLLLRCASARTVSAGPRWPATAPGIRGPRRSAMIKLADLYALIESTFDYLMVVNEREEIVHASRLLAVRAGGGDRARRSLPGGVLTPASLHSLRAAFMPARQGSAPRRSTRRGGLRAARSRSGSAS